MSLHAPRGTSLVEYALVLFVLIGGAAAAVKGTGHAAKESFATVAETVAGATTGIGVPDDADGGSP